MSVFIYHRGTGTVISLEDADVVFVDNDDDQRFSEYPDDVTIIDEIPGYDAVLYLDGYLDYGGEG